jgi:sodium-dependent dicarboxylate transporter 2/3/5
LLGGLFIGRAMSRHGLDRRMALSILCLPGAARSPWMLLAAVGTGVAAISMWISNTAATAMMYPVVVGIISVLGAGRGDENANFARSPFASGLLLMTAYAASVGGIATPIGTATNVLAIGLLEKSEFLGRQFDFVRWAMVGLPMTAAIMLGLCGWLHWRSPAPGLDLPALREYLLQERNLLGPWKRGELNTLAVFLIVVSFWVAPGILALVAGPEVQSAFSRRFPEEITALLAPVLLFMLPVDWKQRRFSLEPADFAKIDWGTVLLFGTGVSLGTLMFKTGLAGVLGQQVFDWLGTRDVWAVTALAVSAGILLSEFTSNAAAAAALLPVVFAICVRAGVDPGPPSIGLAFGASFGSALPVSTPPNAIVYGSGWIPVRRMVVAGIGADVLSGVVIWCVLRLAYALGWSPFAD